METTTYRFSSSDSRTVVLLRTVVNHGKPWFVVVDLAKMIGYRDSNKVSCRVSSTEKTMLTVDTAGGSQKVSLVSETGALLLVATLQQQGSEPLKKWFIEEVLPTIRKETYYRSREDTAALRDELENLQARLEAHKAAHGSAKAAVDKVDETATRRAVRDMTRLIRSHSREVARHIQDIRARLLHLGISDRALQDALAGIEIALDAWLAPA